MRCDRKTFTSKTGEPFWLELSAVRAGPKARWPRKIEAGFPARSVVLTFEWVKGSLGCTAIRSPDGPLLTGRLLRELPLERLMRFALAEVTLREPLDPWVVEQIPNFPEAAVPPFTLAYRAGSAEQAPATTRRRGRKPLDEKYLREVAAIYQEAESLGLPPAKAVAEAKKIAVSTAKKHIMRARRHPSGFMDPHVARLRSRAGQAR